MSTYLYDDGVWVVLDYERGPVFMSPDELRARRWAMQRSYSNVRFWLCDTRIDEATDEPPVKGQG